METGFQLIGFRTMLKFFTRKLLLNRRWLVVLLLAAFLAAVMGYAATLSPSGLYYGSDLMGTLMLSFLLPIMALIYGASMIRNEMDDRSITTVITSPLDRRVSYLGYYFSLTVVLTIMLLLVQLVGWLAYFLVAGMGGEAVGLLLAYSALLVIGSFVYSSLFLTMGVLLKQPIYLGLIYAFVWEGYIGSVPGVISDYTIMHQLKVIGSQLVSQGPITSVSGDVAASSLVLAVLTVVLVVIGAFSFRDKELP
jgi:ABC-type transport system involved in multi-copper enzyme maturation permease subunit